MNDVEKHKREFNHSLIGKNQEEIRKLSDLLDKGNPGSSSGVYVGSGEMPEGYNVQINPEGSSNYLVEVLKPLILDWFMPIGYIYTSLNDTEPSILFGGTWEKIEGRFLLGVGNPGVNTDDYFGQISGVQWYAGAGSKGGQDYHTLTINEMPSHNHTLHRPQWYGGETASGSSIYGTTSSTTLHVDDLKQAIKNTGGGVAHNNMPPYLAVYMWQRIA